MPESSIKSVAGLNEIVPTGSPSAIKVTLRTSTRMVPCVWVCYSAVTLIDNGFPRPFVVVVSNRVSATGKPPKNTPVAERHSSSAGAAGETLKHTTPSCGPGQMQGLVRRSYAGFHARSRAHCYRAYKDIES